MRILRGLFLLIDVRMFRHVLLAVIIENILAGFGNRIFAQTGRVRPHICNQPDHFTADFDSLIELLRQLHGPRCRESELA